MRSTRSAFECKRKATGSLLPRAVGPSMSGPRPPSTGSTSVARRPSVRARLRAAASPFTSPCPTGPEATGSCHRWREGGGQGLGHASSPALRGCWTSQITTSSAFDFVAVALGAARSGIPSRQAILRVRVRARTPCRTQLLRRLWDRCPELVLIGLMRSGILRQRTRSSMAAGVADTGTGTGTPVDSCAPRGGRGHGSASGQRAMWTCGDPRELHTRVCLCSL
jgi:hypothetical protein